MSVLAVSGFLNSWSPSISSTMFRIETRNIEQGGNKLLSAGLQASQAVWAGSLLAEVVKKVVSGPFYYLAQVFRFLFNPFLAYPLSILASAVKERFYQSSLAIKVPTQVKYFSIGPPVPDAQLGTVRVLVGGEEKYFQLSENITYQINNTVEVPEEGKRFWFNRLNQGERFDENCREIEIEGDRVQVRLLWEWNPQNYVEIQHQGNKEYFRLGKEVGEAALGTISIRDPNLQFAQTHYLIGEELDGEAPDCIQLELKEQSFHYHPGIELNAPVDGGRSFEIDGENHYYLSAKFLNSPYLGMSGWFNTICKSFSFPPLLPTRLTKFSVEALEYVCDHMSNLVRTVLFASGVALAWYGFYAMALGTISAISYEFLDHDLGIIPADVSLFMEKWMPMISMCGLLIVGSFSSQIMAGTSLLLSIPELNLYFHQKIAKKTRETLLGISNQIAEWFFEGRSRESFEEFVEFAKRHPVLEEFDSPLVQRKVMERAEIEALLDRGVEDFELNPAHLTKNQELPLVLQENHSFERLIDLWDGVGERWTEVPTFNRLIRRLIDDKLFILFMKERFPEAKRFHYEQDWALSQEENKQQYNIQETGHREQFIRWVDILAREKGMNQREFVADWIKRQLQIYIDKLNGNLPREGGSRLLSEAAEHTAQIIPFLLSDDVTQIDIEDSLVKLAIEGGDYCSVAMRRASKEVLDGFVEPLTERAVRELGPQESFESEVFLNLQKARLRMINGVYANVMRRFYTEEFKDTADDIHVYQMVIKGLKRSFYPLSADEMEDFSITDLAFKETMFMPAEVRLYNEYLSKMPEVIRRIGINPLNQMENRVLEYLRTWVQESQILSAEDKADLLNGRLSNEVDAILDNENYPRWSCLLLTVLGVIRPKRVA